MYSKKRPASIARPRQIAMYLAKEMTQKSLPEIGELLRRARPHDGAACGAQDRRRAPEEHRTEPAAARAGTDPEGVSTNAGRQPTLGTMSWTTAPSSTATGPAPKMLSLDSALPHAVSRTGLSSAKPLMAQAKIAFSTGQRRHHYYRLTRRSKEGKTMIVSEGCAGTSAGRPAVGGRHRRAPAHAADPGQRADAQERRARSSSRPAISRSRCAPRPNWAATPATFATTVGARKLIDILRTLPADQVVTLSANQNKLTLQGGKSRFTLQTLPADDFPLVNEAADFGPAFAVPQKTLQGPDQPGALRDGGARHPLLPERHPVRRRRQDADAGGHRRPPPGAGAGHARGRHARSRR